MERYFGHLGGVLGLLEHYWDILEFWYYDITCESVVLESSWPLQLPIFFIAENSACKPRQARHQCKALEEPSSHSFIHSFMHAWHSFLRSFIHACVHALIHSFIDSVIHAFIHLVIHSFIHPCIHSFRN